MPARLDPFPRQFLLRDDVHWPLSIDRWTWPSIVTDRPAWIGPNSPLWESLDELESHLEDFGQPYTLICASWHTERGEQQGMVGPYEIADLEPDKDWRFLGFDIADPSTSGLSNCGYRPDEHDALAAQWAARINEHHLIPDLNDAFEFRRMTNARVPEHAPFFVIGLWIVRTQPPQPRVQ